MPRTADFAILDTEKVVIETMKLCFDNKFGFIARLYESVGGWTKTRISFPLLKSKQWEAVVADLLEKPVLNATNLKKIADNSEIVLELELKPFELFSIMITKID